MMATTTELRRLTGTDCEAGAACLGDVKPVARGGGRIGGA